MQEMHITIGHTICELLEERVSRRHDTGIRKSVADAVAPEQRTRAGILRAAPRPHDIGVALLTGGRDRPYVFGLATELTSKGATLDLIGSDYFDFDEFHGDPRVNFLNLRGDQRVNASLRSKVSRVSKYYSKADQLCGWSQATYFSHPVEQQIGDL